MIATIAVLVLFSSVAVLEYVRLRSAYRALREDVAKLEKANGFLRKLSLDQSQRIRTYGDIIGRMNAKTEAYRVLVREQDLVEVFKAPKIWPTDEFNCKPHVIRAWRN
jgi:PP-loop superfamily ATP-utilizing enzyme